MGSLKTVPAYQLGSLVLEEAVRRGGIEKKDVEQVIMGDVLSKTPNLARVSALVAGFDERVPGFSVDRRNAWPGIGAAAPPSRRWSAPPTPL